jgi:hypothetical protein
LPLIVKRAMTLPSPGCGARTIRDPKPEGKRVGLQE